jgi:hypothetical protein
MPAKSIIKLNADHIEHRAWQMQIAGHQKVLAKSINEPVFYKIVFFHIRFTG